MTNPALHQRINLRGNLQRFGVVSTCLLTSRPQSLSYMMDRPTSASRALLRGVNLEGVQTGRWSATEGRA